MNLLVKVITNLDCEQFGKINIRDKISKHEIICLMNALVKVMNNLVKLPYETRFQNMKLFTM
jgi:hypothetical protein